MKIELIVDEVIRRLKALENRNNLLIVYHEDTSMLVIEEVLEYIDKTHLKVGIVGFKDPQPLVNQLKKHNIEILNQLSSKEYIHMPYLLERYDGMLVSSMTLGQMYNLSVLNIQQPFEKLTMDWLMAKGKIYIIDTFNMNERILKKELVQRLTDLKMSLTDMGIEWIGKNRPRIRPIVGVLTQEALLGYEQSTLFISQEAVVTPMAKDYARAHQISIERK